MFKLTFYNILFGVCRINNFQALTLFQSYAIYVFLGVHTFALHLNKHPWTYAMDEYTTVKRHMCMSGLWN